MTQGQRELERLHKLRTKIRREIARIDSKILRLERGADSAEAGRSSNGASRQRERGDRSGRQSLSVT